MALDVLYTMAVLSPLNIQHERRVHEAVLQLRQDRVRKVREAANLVAGILRDLGEPEPEIPNTSFLEHRVDVTVSILEQLLELLKSKGLLDHGEVKPLLQ